MVKRGNKQSRSLSVILLILIPKLALNMLAYEFCVLNAEEEFKLVLSDEKTDNRKSAIELFEKHISIGNLFSIIAVALIVISYIATSIIFGGGE